MTMTHPPLACEASPEAWFKENLYEEAKAACTGCPIYGECREIGWGAEYGVFGGLDENDRRRLDPERFMREVGVRRAQVLREDRAERKQPARGPHLCGTEACRRVHGADGLCTFPGCKEPYIAKGLCNRHYSRWQRFNGDVLGGKDHIVRSNEDHKHIHALLFRAMEQWKVEREPNEECIKLIMEAVKRAGNALTRGELDVIKGMGMTLSVDPSVMPKRPLSETRAAEMDMRYASILQLTILGESRYEISKLLGMSMRTVDRARRAVIVGIPARKPGRYELVIK